MIKLLGLLKQHPSKYFIGSPPVCVIHVIANHYDIIILCLDILHLQVGVRCTQRYFTKLIILYYCCCNSVDRFQMFFYTSVQTPPSCIHHNNDKIRKNSASALLDQRIMVNSVYVIFYELAIA